MKIFVTAKPKSKEESVRKIDETHFVVAVKEPPISGQANRAIVKALANYLDLAPSRIQLVLGFSSKQKVFEIL
ncbi:DUF167 domain-containing protein [Candidatus Azambacteria bacterium]|nr:DUF167 domain-containing protein [Candidatus Azambacteria bacterium]